MCITNVTERYDPPNQNEVKAFKLFERRDEELYGLYYAPDGSSEEVGHGSVEDESFQRGVWLKAGYKDSSPDCAGYLPAFHVLATEADAREYQRIHGGDVILPVIVRNVVAVGKVGVSFLYPASATVIAAQELFIPE